MSDHDHYVPVLKAKQGEFWALKALSEDARKAMTPLLEVPSIPWNFEIQAPSKTLHGHLSPIAEKIANSWGTDPIFLDTPRLHPSDRMNDGMHPVTYLLDQMRSAGLNIIPVTGLLHPIAELAAVADGHLKDGLGVALRLMDSDFLDPGSLPGLVRRFLVDLDVGPDEVDLIIDLQDLSPRTEARDLLATSTAILLLPHLDRWRTLTLVGTAFPENLSRVKSGTVGRLPRAEWHIYSILREHPIPRIPTFGDYAVSSATTQPEIDPRVMHMSASIRYTSESDWLIMKGRSIRQRGSRQYHDQCRRLIEMTEYSGPEFSVGDNYINDCAAEVTGPGNATTWRMVGTNHHLEFVSRQIAGLA